MNCHLIGSISSKCTRLHHVEEGRHLFAVWEQRGECVYMGKENWHLASFDWIGSWIGEEFNKNQRRSKEFGNRVCVTKDHSHICLPREKDPFFFAEDLNEQKYAEGALKLQCREAEESWVTLLTEMGGLRFSTQGWGEKKENKRIKKEAKAETEGLFCNRII